MIAVALAYSAAMLAWAEERKLGEHLHFSFNWRIRMGIARDAQLAAFSAAGSGNAEQAAHTIALPDRAVSSK